MGSSVELFKKFKNDCRIFVETGTFTGDGVQRALDAGYEKVYSCEINRDRVLDIIDKFIDKPVMIINAPSELALPDMLSQINEKAVIFLDGHFMPHNPENSDLGFGSDTVREGLPPSPLMDELDIIAKHPIKNHTILIDDTQCFDTWMFGNIKFNDVVEKIYEINPEYNYMFFGNTVCFTVEDEHE